MQISRNKTGFNAGLSVAVDSAAREHCVVVIKGTFSVSPDGSTRPAEYQRPLVFTDEHFGAPDTTSIRHECDFAFHKPLVDILVYGHAVSKTPCERMHVRLELPGVRKDILVTGDRRWESGLGGIRASPPQPFTRIPLVFDRAFGGTDQSHPDPRFHASEPRNPVGVGFRANPRASDAIGISLPNLEDPRAPMSTWADRPAPTGCGAIGRAWLPRIRFAGTYDRRWRDEVAPFLPTDFDQRYFQAAPSDQQMPRLNGGDVIAVEGTRERGRLVAIIPHRSLLVRYRFSDRDVFMTPVLDTVLVDCDSDTLVLTWRCAAALGKRLVALRDIEIQTSNRAETRPIGGSSGFLVER